MYQLDELDIKILAQLRNDGRLSNVEIARLVDTSERTVRRRIDTLVKSGIAEITVVLNPEEVGYNLAVHINLQVELDKIESVAAKLSQFEHVNYVCLLTGEFDVMFNAMFRSSNGLRNFLTIELAAIEGIKHVQTSHVLQEVKRTNYWVPLTANSRSDDQVK